MKNKIISNKGSITIEAAVILPLIVCVFILFYSLIAFCYIHVKVQLALNHACQDMAMDSYAFEQFGIIDGIESIYEKGARSQIDVATCISFYEAFSSTINIQSSTEPNLQEDSSEELNNNYIESYLEKFSSIFGMMSSLNTLAKSMSQIAATEGIYFLTSEVGKAYFDSKVEKFLSAEDININIRVKHVELFLENKEARIIIDYPCRLPLNLLGNFKFNMENSSYCHTYTGAGDYQEKTNGVVEVSHYGDDSSGIDDLVDQDGLNLAVYVTPKGTKYHKNPLCFHIAVNFYPVILSSIYIQKCPCEHCCLSFTDSNLNMLVYTTTSSHVFHMNPTCHAIYHDIEKLTEKEAITKGYTPCLTCSY